MALLCCHAWGLLACSQPQCSQDSDCTQGTCQDGQCRGQGVESTPDGGGQNERSSTEASNDRKDAGPTEQKAEPPPFPDIVWKEGKQSPPESLTDSLFPESFNQGQRQLGQTCNPQSTALAQDRCATGMLCAAPGLKNLGTCQKICKPDDSSTCPQGQVCGPVVTLETRTLVGHSCGVPVGRYESCSFGRPCAKGERCVPISGNRGLCLKSCASSSDCPAQGSCEPFSSLPGEAQGQACYTTIFKEGEICGRDQRCGPNLFCISTSIGPSRCRKSCLQSGCGGGFTCISYKDYQGKVVRAACLPIRKRGETCDSTQRCDKDLSCGLFGTQRKLGLCLTNCTKDPKVCKADESCTTYNSRASLCYRNAGRGEACDGAVACAKGLTCLALRKDGPRFCVAACDKDPKACAKTELCTKTGQDAKAPQVCLPRCDAKQPCTWKGFACDNQSTLCRPDPTQNGGTATLGASCQTSPAAAAALRCGAGLSCLRLAQGWTCTQPCDPSQPKSACPQGQQCLQAIDQEGGFFCAVAVKTGEVCDLAQAKLCANDARCVQQVYRSKGRCIANNTQPKGQFCPPAQQSCAKDAICAGDPTTPYRWRCLTRCDPTSPRCEAQEQCITLQQGGACFPDCASDATRCQSLTLRCQEIQQKKVCL